MRYLWSAALLAILLAAACDDGPTTVCFVAGTEILTPRGPVRIEELRTGDELVCVDPETGAAAVGKVRAMRSAVSTEHLSIRTDDGRRVEVTRHHPFWDPHARKFRSIGTFPPGDSLLVWQDGECRVVRVASVEIIHRPETVYHPEVDRPPHTFVADGFIVHNKPPEIPLVDVTLRVVPGDAGWINLGNRFVGQGSDTSFTLTNGSYFLEAVAREGWMFDHWEGDVSPVDTFVVNFQPRDGDRVACHFAPRP